MSGMASPARKVRPMSDLVDKKVVLRFWQKVERHQDDECWPWTGAKLKKDGRGRFWFGGRMRVAPAVSLLLHSVDQPNQLHFACHKCDNPKCVNPKHLWWGTVKDNAIDASKKGRLNGQSKTICKRGHPLSGDNLFYTSQGSRSCHQCMKLHRERHASKPDVKLRKLELQRIRRAKATALAQQEGV